MGKSHPSLQGISCESCGAVHVSPAWACSACGSDRFEEPISLSGKASIVSHTVVRRPSPGFPDAPYMIVVAKLVEGPELLGWLQNFEIASTTIGDQIRFDHFDHRGIPQFCRA
ncbi:hypothetical protein EDM59_05725 [Brevibacillus nitrificans]|uniref:ChsH2 C-terminal OB-fold domain-containing protein n=1 Tax=Brevibacillus nitrificans TaxID=651560 RepID=A0A3M8DKJ6_9BACL|nr:OB-fold domain-containing protein [Brevibacillus nitrificans]RNB88612.1 hypothetical protein EDM59_05725 [Brevibacillus nitrificans]